MATKEELENFYRENRIRQAQSVAPTVYDDSANAPTFFGSSLPIGQVERNLSKQMTHTILLHLLMIYWMSYKGQTRPFLRTFQ